MLHLPGKDKMTLSSKEGTHVTMDRVLIAATPSYDLYRHNTDNGTKEKIGWMEKKLIALGDTFDVYMEGKGGFGVTGLFKPTPAYRIEGDFLDRNFRLVHSLLFVICYTISIIDVCWIVSLLYFMLQHSNI